MRAAHNQAGQRNEILELRPDLSERVSAPRQAKRLRVATEEAGPDAAPTHFRRAIFPGATVRSTFTISTAMRRNT